MKIAIAGWYKQNNAGDDRILYCLQKYLGITNTKIFVAWKDVVNRIDEINQYDLLLIGGGGLIIRNGNSIVEKLNNIKIPVALVGISVEYSTNNGLLIEYFDKKCEFILVRDKRSALFFNTNKRVFVGPDLTFLYPLQPLNKNYNDECSVNLRPWHYWKGEQYSYFYYKFKLLNHKFPFINKIYPFGKWNPGKLISLLENHFNELSPAPFHSIRGSGIDDSKLLKQFFDDVPVNFDFHKFMNSDYYVGMRLHGLIFATQLGIPFISLSYMPKSKEFCSMVGMKDYSLDLWDSRDWEKTIINLKNNRESITEQLVATNKLFNQEITQIFHSILPLNDELSSVLR